MATIELPNHFTDSEILENQYHPLNSSTEEEISNLNGRRHYYPLTLGLLMRLHTGMKRVVRKSLCSPPPDDNYEVLLIIQ